MDSEELTVEELEAKRRMYAHLAQGAADVKAGRVQPLDDGAVRQGKLNQKVT